MAFGKSRLDSKRRMRVSLTGAIFFAAILAAAASIADARSYRFITHTAGNVDYWPRFSPDGKTVLFSRCEISSGCGGASTSGYWELWTAPARGGRATNFIAISDVSATRSNWLWNTNSSITTPITFTGVPIGPGDGHLWLSDAAGQSPLAVDTPADVVPVTPHGCPTTRR